MYFPIILFQTSYYYDNNSRWFKTWDNLFKHTVCTSRIIFTEVVRIIGHLGRYTYVIVSATILSRITSAKSKSFATLASCVIKSSTGCAGLLVPVRIDLSDPVFRPKTLWSSPQRSVRRECSTSTLNATWKTSNASPNTANGLTRESRTVWGGTPSFSPSVAVTVTQIFTNYRRACRVW